MSFRTTTCDIETCGRLILLLLCLSVAVGEVACGGGSSSGSGSSTPSVSLSTKPPASMAAGGSTSLVATITSDPKNLGVVWSCTPGNSSATCGSFKPTNTVTTTYTGPSISASVTITVTSVADSAVSANATVTVTAANAPTVAFTTAPPAGMFTGTSANLTATTTGDLTNGGVTWSCTPAATCGSFTPQSGTSASYAAPPSAGAVTITAALASYPDITVSAPVNIITALNGYYIFSLSGSGKNPNAPPALLPYFVAGTFYVTDGHIKSGEQDSFNTGTSTQDLINPNGSTFGLTADGHLNIQLQTCNGGDCSVADQSIGVNGVETFDAAFLPLNPNRALLMEFDSSVAASGTLDWHDPMVSFATPSGGYVFELNGLSTLTNYNGPMSMAGVINIDGTGTISGTGSMFDACIAGSGNEYLAQTFATGSNTVSTPPDQFGRVYFILNPANNDHFPQQITLAGYIVDASHIRLVEIIGGFGGILGGSALGQGTTTGTFSSTNVSGQSYVIGLTGDDVKGAAQLAGVLAFNTDGTVSGFGNYNDLTPPSQGPNPITAATYTVDATGRVTITGVNSAPFNVGTNTIDYLELYLDGSGHAVATVLNGIGNTIGGLGYQQSQTTPFTAASLSGSYVIDATGRDHAESGELDAVGEVTATASSATFAGATDLNWLLSASPTATNLPLSGTLSATGGAAASGVFTGSLTGLDVTTPANKDQFSFYLIDSNGDAIAIETDVNQLTLVSFFQQ